MSFALTESTLQTLRDYLKEVKSTSSEIGKRERFSSLLGVLFGNTREIGIYAQGSERSLYITTSKGAKRGQADNLYGSAIIEFEKDLKKTLAEAERQLREYVAGIWQQAPDKRRPLDAVASDGVLWRIYRPVLPEGEKLVPENIVLTLRDEIPLKEDKLGDFYRWLNNFLFRPSQLEPTSDAIRADFGATSHLFMDGLPALRHAWVSVRQQSEARLAFDTWQRYLIVTYGQLGESERPRRDKETGEETSELEDLFLRHTYLVCVSRLMVWAALSSGQTDKPFRQVAKDVFSGSFFEAKHLANLADDDFFHWIQAAKAEQQLAPVWETALSVLLTYDLTLIKEDVLKGVYQQLIDPKDRHDLGEYYTPDWLCEHIVARILPGDEAYKKTVLDPSCGSGSFLRAAVHHYLEHHPAGTANERLRAVTASIKGIDIHPVAVTVARATYILALGKLVNAARRPVQIPVYLADALFLPHEVDVIQGNLYEQLSGIEITFGPRSNRRKFVLPDMMVQNPEGFDELIVAATRVAEHHAERGKESRASLERYLKQSMPEFFHRLQSDEVVTALWTFAEGLSQLIKEKQNSIWSFIIRNSYRPAMLRRQFDIIIGNPPWVSYRYVSDPEYQKEIKHRAVENYKIAPKSQKLFTQMELATVFLAHALETFARPGAKLAFVMPRSILSADQHQNLIQRKYSAHFRLLGYWDLWDVKPLFNVPSCVLFAEQSKRLGSVNEALPVEIWQGRLPDRDLSWEKATEKFSIKKDKARVIWLGNRSAFSTESGAKTQTRSSSYANLFKDGATIYPRSFFFVSIEGGLQGKPDPERVYYARTSEESIRTSKSPYQDVYLEGLVEGRFLFSTAIARHVLPFVLLEPSPVVLPLEESNGSYYTMTTDELFRKGFREAGDWLLKAEAIWEKKRGKKSDRLSLLQRIDYQRGITAQSPAHRYVVLYNAAGTNVSATFCDFKKLDLRLIVEHKLYWAAFRDAKEAHFVSAVLNSACVNEAIKPFQSAGLLGERDIEKKVLDLAIPLYDAKNPTHLNLSELGLQAHELAQTAVLHHAFSASSSLARQRAYVRTAIQNQLDEIDKLVRPLLGLH